MLEMEAKRQQSIGDALEDCKKTEISSKPWNRSSYNKFQMS